MGVMMLAVILFGMIWNSSGLKFARFSPLEAGDDPAIFEEFDPAIFEALGGHKMSCIFKDTDTPGNTVVYETLFTALSGKTIFMVGDSTMQQTFTVLTCGAKLHDWDIDFAEDHKWTYRKCPGQNFCVSEEFGKEKPDPDLGKALGELQKAKIKRSKDAPDDTAISFYFWKLYWYNKGARGVHNSSWGGGSENSSLATDVATLFDVEQHIEPDHIFLNFGHHVWSQPTELLEKEVREIVDVSTNQFSKLEQVLLEKTSKKRSLVFIGHPPQHFTGTGNYRDNLCSQSEAQCCTNDVQQIQTEDVKLANDVCRAIVKEYHFGFIDIWDELAPYGDMHFPEEHDCTHFHLSPALWKGVAQKLFESL